MDRVLRIGDRFKRSRTRRILLHSNHILADHSIDFRIAQVTDERMTVHDAFQVFVVKNPIILAGHAHRRTGDSQRTPTRCRCDACCLRFDSCATHWTHASAGQRGQRLLKAQYATLFGVVCADGDRTAVPEHVLHHSTKNLFGSDLDEMREPIGPHGLQALHKFDRTGDLLSQNRHDLFGGIRRHWIG